MGLQFPGKVFNPVLKIGIIFASFRLLGKTPSKNTWLVNLLSIGDIRLFTFLRVFTDIQSSPLALFGSKFLIIFNTSVSLTSNQKNYY